MYVEIMLGFWQLLWCFDWLMLWLQHQARCDIHYLWRIWAYGRAFSRHLNGMDSFPWSPVLQHSSISKLLSTHHHLRKFDPPLDQTDHVSIIPSRCSLLISIFSGILSSLLFSSYAFLIHDNGLNTIIWIWYWYDTPSHSRYMVSSINRSVGVLFLIHYQTRPPNWIFLSYHILYTYINKIISHFRLA